MKPDKLEQFVSDNRPEFDYPEPGEHVWENINGRLRPVPRLNWRRAFMQAAAVIAVFIASWLIHDLVNKGQRDGQVAFTEQGERTPDPSMVELMEAEVFYSAKINTAKEEIYRLSGQDSRLMDVLNYDLDELEQVFEELKGDLRDNSDNQEVIEAMIQNYRIKLEILEEMLNQLNRSGESDKKNNGYEI